MDFQSAMETFAEAWVAANTKGGALPDVGCTQSQAMALTRSSKSPTPPPGHRLHGLGETPVAADSSSQQDAPAASDGYDSAKSSCGKSLPVHCVVEAVSTLDDTKFSWKRKSVVETDSYVIIPVNTAFHELVQVVLHRLGYPRDSVSAAKGSVIIKNWKPLSFDKIAESPSVTVGDILGELTTVATLRIQLYRARPTVLSEIKEKLLRLLIAKSHNLLLSSGCPLDEVTLSQLCRGPQAGSCHQPLPEPSDECRRKFEQWWSVQVNQQGAGTATAPLTPRPLPANRYSPHRTSPAKLADRQPAMPENVHPALQTVQSQYPTQKTRMRTSFDPELELPKLQKWFFENQHPSRQQIHQYVKELNGLESRRGRKPLDVNNVVYWFKNARAAQKRAELRSIAPGMGCPLSMNGYSSNSHSPPNPGLLVGQEGLMPPHQHLSHPQHRLKSPSPGHGFLTDHKLSDNSDVEAGDEEQPPPAPHPAARPRDYRDPREELRSSQAAAEVDDGRYTGSPAAPLSLTTGDKSGARSPTQQPQERSSRDEDSAMRTNGDEMSCDGDQERERVPSPNGPLSLTLCGKDLKSPPLKQHLPTVEGIKQEPPDDVTCQGTTNNNNNLSKPDDENVSEMEDEDEDEGEDMEDKRKEPMDGGEEESGLRPVRLSDMTQHHPPYRSPSPCDMVMGRGMPGDSPDLERLAAGFPLVPNSMFSHSIMYMSHYIPGLAAHPHHPAISPSAPAAPTTTTAAAGLNLSALAAASADERRKRNRTFIDPVTEVPRLEQWFSLNTHPSHNLILKYTEELNRMPYRQKFPRLEPKNVQFWFKNRRAKCKRLKMSLFETGPSAVATNHHQMPYHHPSPSSDGHRSMD